MKALEIPSDTQHLVLLEKGDRFLALEKEETAVVIGGSKTDKDINVAVHFPKLEEGDEVPLSVMMSACVREFLHDPELVKLVQQRIKVKQDEMPQTEDAPQQP